jgi:hypothetical protein
LVYWRGVELAAKGWWNLAQSLIAGQDRLVLVPRAIVGDNAILDGLQPPVVALAQHKNIPVYVWLDGRWLKASGPVVWDVEVYEDQEGYIGNLLANPRDELLKGILAVSPLEPA